MDVFIDKKCTFVHIFYSHISFDMVFAAIGAPEVAVISRHNNKMHAVIIFNSFYIPALNFFFINNLFNQIAVFARDRRGEI